MKANEAPEKVYVHKSQYFGLIAHEHNITNGIEYTRTDAFIEKAENYLRNKCQRFILTEKDIEDFRKYMEGE